MDYRQAGERIRRGEISSFYLFNGPDEYLKEELLQKIIMSLGKKGKHFSVERINAKYLEKGLSDFIQELQQTTIQTLLSEGRVLWIYNSSLFSPPPKDTPSKKDKSLEGENEILRLLEQKLSEIILIFSVPQADKRKKIVKMVEKAGKFIDFPVLKGSALLKWLTDRLARENLRIEDDAAHELLERTGENLTLINSEIEKISTYLCGEKTISMELIHKLVPGSSLGNIFQLTEAVARKKMDEALRQLHRIRAQDEHPLVILAMIVRQFRLLFQLCLLEKKGCSRREILAALKIQPFLLNKLQEQVKNFTPSSLARIISDLKEMDAAIKNGQLDSGDALEQMVLKLTVG
ncbi:MAG: DNA polymerase III subunit delta [Firmicutes bacterium]|nr:DNA polymerase III subunit delta [Bacillota bacterium]